MEVITLAWTLGFVAVLLLQRSIDRRAWPAWDGLRRGADGRVQALWESCERRRNLIALAVRAAHAEHTQGNAAQAARMLRSSLEALEMLVDDLLKWLQEWSDTARAWLPLAPVEPPRAGALKLPRLRALALTWKLAHGVAITRRERFLLRTFMLAHALRTLLVFWRRTRLPRRTCEPWARAVVLQADLATLAEASVETYDAFLLSQQVEARAKTN